MCNLNELDDVSTIKICSEHFTTDDYRNPLAPVYGGVLKLKTGVIPTLSVPNPIAPISMSVNNKDTDVESTTNVAGTSEEIGSEYVTISGKKYIPFNFYCQYADVLLCIYLRRTNFNSNL